MRYLLDNNAVSELSKPAANPGFAAWWEENSEESGIPAVVLAELWADILALESIKRRNRLTRGLRFFLEDIGNRVADFGPPEARITGSLAAAARVQLGAKWVRTHQADLAIYVSGIQEHS